MGYKYAGNWLYRIHLIKGSSIGCICKVEIFAI